MRLLLALSLVLAMAAYVESKEVTCWTCDSEKVDDCDKDTQSETCDGECMKIIASAAGYSVISRSCSSVCANFSPAGDSGTHCCDNENYCNSATGLTLSITMALGAALWAKLA